ncbi:MAG: transketolase, partial [Chlorobi bacterium]|nr:transketolase [Chlorobiota bacterium]
MKFENQTIEEKSINAIRLLSADAIQKANSGHPGLPMGCAPLAFWLYSNAMKHNPKNPNWKNRDRFVLSGGHGSMLLYSALHLSGYDISMDDIKDFRQWGSVTPGHPEFGLTPGVETTTGPLGQGFANAIGMAAAEKFLAAKFNKENFELLNHKIYTLMGDGDMMEGLSHEAASFAGRNKLDNLIAFYDNNTITIEGRTSLAFTEDVAKRFESYDWFVQHVSDINDLKQLDSAIENAKAAEGKPSLIIVDSVIGYGSPNKKDTAGIHGSPLGEEELRLTKENLGWDPDKSFFVPDEVYEYFKEKTAEGAEAEEEWNKLFADYKNKFPKEAKLFEKIFAGNFGGEWKGNLPEFNEFGSKLATRSASGKVINAMK